MSLNLLSTNNRPANNKGSQPGLVEQLVLGLGLVFTLYVVLIFFELMYKYFNRLSLNRTEVLPKTYSTENKSIDVIQNPYFKDSKTVHLSDNERTGIEFSYAFYLNVHPSTFRQEEGLLHIFHKGYSSQFPLLAPGVYMCSHTNTLRVYMNTFKTWNNYIDVEDFPVRKWVHVVIVCKNSALEIYINGNLTKKMSFEGFTPYQNYQDICCFSQRPVTLLSSQISSLQGQDFKVHGVMKGLLSRLTYFSYALCYSEIQKIMTEGPSNEMDDSLMNNIPPYLADNWWSKSY